jgi:hypothetical protein
LLLRHFLGTALRGDGFRLAPGGLILGAALLRKLLAAPVFGLFQFALALGRQPGLVLGPATSRFLLGLEPGGALLGLAAGDFIQLTLPLGGEARVFLGLPAGGLRLRQPS